ncbi:hypothetical protein [Novosphingobium sp. UBA1939]|uniref:hypothetical protein n=1 Tax=Novosphingobium sp. UBA1939 TaxID=1946982 RepID=UPI0025EFED9C|nr:hypothetical protein [Novosphingobium sp. UBA1939]
MSIGSITSAVTSAASSGSTLASLLQTSGLSADKIKIVEGDLADTRQSLASSMSASVSGTVDSTAFRAAIDAKIADDVASGKLTAKDAEAVGKALDQIEGTASGASASTDASGAASVTAAAAGGHGGGGGGDTKTEVSRVETVAGGIMTTVITYSDGSTETQTSVTTDPDTGSTNATSGTKTGKSDEQKAQDYLASLQPGTLFNVMA